MPVPRVAQSTKRWPRPEPKRHSARAAVLASLSTTTGSRTRSATLARNGSRRQFRWGENITTVRVTSTKPAAPIPTAATSNSRANPWTRSTMVSSTACTSWPSVGRRSTAITAPSGSTTAPSTLVPPMSIPTVSGSHREGRARRGTTSDMSIRVLSSAVAGWHGPETAWWPR